MTWCPIHRHKHQIIMQLTSTTKKEPWYVDVTNWQTNTILQFSNKYECCSHTETHICWSVPLPKQTPSEEQRRLPEFSVPASWWNFTEITCNICTVATAVEQMHLCLSLIATLPCPNAFWGFGWQKAQRSFSVKLSPLWSCHVRLCSKT